MAIVFIAALSFLLSRAMLLMTALSSFLALAIVVELSASAMLTFVSFSAMNWFVLWIVLKVATAASLLYHDNWPASKFWDDSTKLLLRINRALKFWRQGTRNLRAEFFSRKKVEGTQNATHLSTLYLCNVKCSILLESWGVPGALQMHRQNEHGNNEVYMHLLAVSDPRYLCLGSAVWLLSASLST